MLGRFDEALADVTSALKSDPTNLELLEAAANLHLYLGHSQEYQTIRSELIRLSTDSKGDHPAKTCLLYPLAGEEAKAVMAMTDRALSSGARAFILQFFHSAKGMAEYRSGNYADAVEWLTLGRDALTKTIEARPAEREISVWDDVRTTDEFFLAMAKSRLGHQHEALDNLAQAQEQLRTLTPSASSVHGRLATTNWLMVQIVAREAERTVDGTAPSSKPATTSATLPTSASNPQRLKNAQNARP